MGDKRRWMKKAESMSSGPDTVGKVGDGMT